ncbi:beta-mannanase [Neobacillus sp. MM2021_6]|uniref:beta-mannanase n=1 Tax=Bacillaceae TaxID=186817 RepID=UPI00140DF5EF|nr:MULTISPECIES: beta-mannanase [Bacillaceae]MBO0961666.1 beta-mannanase [Neobacillus sp. MM2021_6]NHC20568.1 beta-mannanase [Bacillus sp. MM2020_4]
MNWEPISSPNQEIKDVKQTIQDAEVRLNWFWSNEIDFVYIYKTASDNFKPADEIAERDVKLYTREEYKINRGYVSKLDTIGRTLYRIFPCQKREGKLVVFRQEDEKNLITIMGARAKIYFSIAYKNKLFQPRKKVKMAIHTELPLEKGLLVYVKKSGGVPNSLEDGTAYPFVRDFPAGKTVSPEIEIDKNEFIRIFFSTGKNIAQHYELIPE